MAFWWFVVCGILLLVAASGRMPGWPVTRQRPRVLLAVAGAVGLLSAAALAFGR